MTALQIAPFLCIGALLVSARGHSQGEFRLNFRHLTPQSGLSSIFVRKIAQDPEGYIWAGTEDGLNRYEGRDFTIYDKERADKHSVAGADTRDLMADSLHHLLWQITSYGGIDGIDYITGNVIYSLRQNQSRAIADIVFNSLALTGDRLYIGSTSGLFLLDIVSRHLSRVPFRNPFSSSGEPISIDNLLVGPDGRLWLFCRNQGVVVLQDSAAPSQGVRTIAMVQFPSGVETDIYKCILLKDGRILAATSRGLLTFSSGSEQIRSQDNAFEHVPFTHGRDVYSCAQDRLGHIWVCSEGHLLRIQVDGSSWQEVVEEKRENQLDWLGAIYEIYFDRDDNVWLGCQAGLAFSPNRQSCFTVLDRSTDSETRIKHAYTLEAVGDSLLYCCAQDGLYCVWPKTGVIRSLDDRRAYYHAFIDPFGRLMVSNIDGTFIVKGKKWIPAELIYPELRRLGRIVINSRCYFGDSVLVFGTQNSRGVVTWNFKKARARIINQYTNGMWLKELRVTAVYRDHRGCLWVMGNKSISILDLARNSIRTLSTYDSHENKFYSLFFDVCEAKGMYFVSSYGEGVIILDSNYRITGNITTLGSFVNGHRFMAGLCANSVYKLIPFRDSLLFVTSNYGLSVVDLTQKFYIKSYYANDGLNTDNFEENSATISGNVIYVGGADGVTAIEPALFKKAPPPPPVSVKNISIETERGSSDTSNHLLNFLEIPADDRQTTVYFSSLYYANPFRLRLSYKLKGDSLAWINMSDRNFVSFFGMNPGVYTLQVRSTNEDGISSNRYLELTLKFLPKWYQTLWFKLLSFAVLSLLLYGLYLYRIRQLRKQHQIRRAIASDLHDDIGSTLNTVKLFAQLARRDQQKGEYLGRIEESLVEASSGLRDMIWVLDDSGDTVRELADRIRKFAVPIAQLKQIEFQCMVDDRIAGRKLNKSSKKNLLLIAKESITNSLKYSECRHISVAFGEYDDKFAMVIQDDGVGFDLNNYVPGNGLRNIRQRARQIGTTATIRSTPGLGTRIDIR